MSKIKILVSTVDIYDLQTRTVSLPGHEKLLKEVGGGSACTFYKFQY